MDCEVRRVNDDWKLWKYASKAEFGISPVRWLNLIHSSTLILSDSFHATAFAILLRKNFLAVLANPENKQTNRIVNLLERLHLQDRIVGADEPMEAILYRCRQPIDWDAAHAIMHKSRQSGLQYLANALGR